MRIGIIVLSIGNFGQKGFYNLQEIGLAKALDKIVDEVKVYKLISRDNTYSEKKLDGSKNTSVIYLPSYRIGTNGVPDMSEVDSSIDALICFADTQIMFAQVNSWCAKHNVIIYPYVGVVESHSNSKLKKIIVERMFARNLRAYRKCDCFAKTPIVKEKLVKAGVTKCHVMPVGLDASLLRWDYEKCLPYELKRKYGYQKSDKILLFVGRLIQEKQPIRMIEIFSKVLKRDENYKLLMVGTGELTADVEVKIRELGLQEEVRMIARIQNSEMWMLYRFAEAFVNLNQQEIFGMAVLEAMFYGCKVVAWKAPGPSYIIENGISGWLVESEQEFIDRIIDSKEFSATSQERVINEFLWESTANKMISIIGEQ